MLIFDVVSHENVVSVPLNFMYYNALPLRVVSNAVNVLMHSVHTAAKTKRLSYHR
jgi:hypothetical protein